MGAPTLWRKVQPICRGKTGRYLPLLKVNLLLVWIINNNIDDQARKIDICIGNNNFEQHAPVENGPFVPVPEAL
jgi:hypothetical protein